MAVIEAIETVYLEDDVASVSFSSLGSYEHLQLHISIRGRRDSTVNRTMITLNSDTASNYTGHAMYGTGSSDYTFAYTNASLFFFWNTTPGFSVPATSIGAGIYAVGSFDILDYRNTNKNTQVMGSWGLNRGTFGEVFHESSVWNNTAAVTSIQVNMDPTYDTARGSMISLYGLNSS